MDKILSLENIHFRYYPDSPNVLTDLSLDIPAGKVTAILGPNGTGKTTLLHILLGLLKPFQGQVKISGKSHRDYSRKDLSQMIGLVPQFESIPFNFSVFEYVLLGRSPYLKPFQLPGAQDIRITEDALKSGILFLERVETGGFRWVSDQTTYAVDNNFVFNSIQAVYVSDLMALTLIQTFDRLVVGKSVAQISAAAALSIGSGCIGNAGRAALLPADSLFLSLDQ